MRKPAFVATLVAAGIVASLVATIPGAFAGPEAKKLKVMRGTIGVQCYAPAPGALCSTRSRPERLERATCSPDVHRIVSHSSAGRGYGGSMSTSALFGEE